MELCHSRNKFEMAVTFDQKRINFRDGTWNVNAGFNSCHLNLCVLRVYDFSPRKNAWSPKNVQKFPMISVLKPGEPKISGNLPSMLSLASSNLCKKGPRIFPYHVTGLPKSMMCN